MSRFHSSSRRNFLKWALATGFSTALLNRSNPWAQNPTDTSIKADLILHNGRIATQDGRQSFAEAVAIKDNRFLAVGTEREVMAYKGGHTQLIDLNARTVIPGLERYPHPSDSWRFELQHGAPLGWGALFGRCPADAERAGAQNSSTPVGASNRRLERIPVCGTPDADASRDKCCFSRRAGLHPQFVQSGAAQSSCTQSPWYRSRYSAPTGLGD